MQLVRDAILSILVQEAYLILKAWPHQVVLGQDSGLEKPGFLLRAG